MTRDWIASPSPRDRAPSRDQFEMRAWDADSYESTFADYPGPGENTRPDLMAEPFMCRCKCGCQNVAEHGLFCGNCDPGGCYASSPL